MTLRRISLLIVLSALTIPAAARVYHVSQLPDAGFVDGERTKSVEMNNLSVQDPRIFRVELALEAASNRYVEVAWGSDAVHTNGQLSASEEKLAIAFDCGEWIVTKGVKEVIAVPCVCTNGAVVMRMQAEFTKDSELVSLTFAENGVAFAVSGFAVEDAAPILMPESWDLLRVTTRGEWGEDPVADCFFSPRRTLVILR